MSCLFTIFFQDLFPLALKRPVGEFTFVLHLQLKAAQEWILSHRLKTNKLVMAVPKKCNVEMDGDSPSRPG